MGPFLFLEKVVKFTISDFLVELEQSEFDALQTAWRGKDVTGERGGNGAGLGDAAPPSLQDEFGGPAAGLRERNDL